MRIPQLFQLECSQLTIRPLSSTPVFECFIVQTTVECLCIFSIKFLKCLCRSTVVNIQVCCGTMRPKRCSEFPGSTPENRTSVKMRTLPFSRPGPHELFWRFTLGGVFGFYLTFPCSAGVGGVQRETAWWGWGQPGVLEDAPSLCPQQESRVLRGDGASSAGHLGPVQGVPPGPAQRAG